MSNQTARLELRAGVGHATAGDALGFFERQAQRVWNSHLEPDDKALRLYMLGDTIAKYTSRLEGNPGGDLWGELTLKRRKADLTRLSEDVCLLAISATHLQTKGDLNE